MTKEIDEFSKPLKILVVEDNEVDRRLLESMLAESTNHTGLVKTAGSLAQAFQLAGEFDFEVTILDLNLPDSHGIHTLIVFHEKYPHMPIVISTGSYEDELGIEALSKGAQDFLVKGRYNSYVLNKSLRYCLHRKHLEMQLKETYENLARAQTQLAQTEKMRIIGTLASGVAHEVRNPLSTILYGVAYLSDEAPAADANYKFVLTGLKEAAMRANEIISDMLDFSGLTKLKIQETDVNMVIEKSLVLTNYELDKNHVQIHKRLFPDLPRLSVDANRIEQVLINLILNAAAAMPNGGDLKITTATQPCELKNDNTDVLSNDHFKSGDTLVAVTIEDTGAGIP